MFKVTLFFVLFFALHTYGERPIFDSTKVYVGRLKIENNCPMPDDNECLEFVFLIKEDKPILKLISYNSNFSEKQKVDELKCVKTESNQFLFLSSNSKFQLSIKMKNQKSILIIRRIEKVRMATKRKQKVKLFPIDM